MTTIEFGPYYINACSAYKPQDLESLLRSRELEDLTLLLNPSCLCECNKFLLKLSVESLNLLPVNPLESPSFMSSMVQPDILLRLVDKAYRERSSTMLWSDWTRKTAVRSRELGKYFEKQRILSSCKNFYKIFTIKSYASADEETKSAMRLALQMLVVNVGLKSNIAAIGTLNYAGQERLIRELLHKTLSLLTIRRLATNSIGKASYQFFIKYTSASYREITALRFHLEYLCILIKNLLNDPQVTDFAFTIRLHYLKELISYYTSDQAVTLQSSSLYTLTIMFLDDFPDLLPEWIFNIFILFELELRSLEGEFLLKGLKVFFKHRPTTTGIIALYHFLLANRKDAKCLWRTYIVCLIPKEQAIEIFHKSQNMFLDMIDLIPYKVRAINYLRRYRTSLVPQFNIFMELELFKSMTCPPIVKFVYLYKVLQEYDKANLALVSLKALKSMFHQINAFDSLRELIIGYFKCFLESKMLYHVISYNPADKRPIIMPSLIFAPQFFKFFGILLAKAVVLKIKTPFILYQPYLDAIFNCRDDTVPNELFPKYNGVWDRKNRINTYILYLINSGSSTTNLDKFLEEYVSLFQQPRPHKHPIFLPVRTDIDKMIKSTISNGVSRLRLALIFESNLRYFTAAEASKFLFFTNN